MTEPVTSAVADAEPTPPDLLEAQKRVLELIVQNVPLSDVLGSLCRIVEEQAPAPVRAAILLVTPDGRHLATGAAPGLPESYSRAIDGIAISAFVGTCAAAAARRHVITTPDIATDPGWHRFKHLPLGLGLKAAWSMPIFSAAGAVLGTFGTYFTEEREPVAAERKLVEVLARTAALAIERQRSDEALKHREAQYRAMIEATPECVKIVAADGTLLQVNAAGLRIFEVADESEVRGRSVYDGLVPEDRERYREFNDRVCRGESASLRFSIVTRSGGRRTMESNAVPLASAGGGFAQLSVTRDITQQGEIDAALRASEKQLRDADRRKDEFIAVLAHELRNPLVPIRTGVELLKRARERPALIDAIRPMMERQVGHMVRLIDDLLDVSRITSGKIELRRQRVTLGSVVGSAIEANRAAIVGGGLELSTNLDDPHRIIEVDPTRFSQVISNLVQNAAKFTAQGGKITITAAVESAARAKPPELVLNVVDTGIGIEAHELPRVFDLFAQAHPGGYDRHAGLGIGLALARSLVQLHGGSIAASSAGAGKGSVFTVRVPAPVLAPAHAADSLTSRSLEGLRVLVVDDNRDAADAMMLLVSQLGGDVRVAYDGRSALASLDQFHASVVLLDIGMPGLNGYQTCRHIREKMGAAVCVVAVTGWGQEQDRQLAAEAGFDMHMTKPADPGQLVELLGARAGIT
jgi:PAS domain S-box-containing protein